jgi:hypothetical protein
MVTVIGRGHSGTRAMSHTLSESDVFMGELLNRSGDLLPPEGMYEACRLFARYVEWRGGLEWDWGSVDRWKEDEVNGTSATSYYDFFAPAMRAYGYTAAGMTVLTFDA